MTDRGWAILILVFMTLLFSPVIIGEYSKSQCRIEAIKAGVEADKIKTACGIK